MFACNMKQFYLLVSMLLLLAACDKQPRAITITGRLMEDCSGTPIAGRHLRVSNVDYSGWADKESNQNAGSGVTASDGTFSFSIEASGVDEFELHDDDSGGSWLQSFNGPVAPNNTCDVGALYNRFEQQGTFTVRVTATFPGTDTLYYGTSRSGDSIRILHPIVPATLRFMRAVSRSEAGYGAPLSFTKPDSTDIHWGIGRLAFDSSVSHLLQQGGNVRAYQRFRLALYPCAPGDGIAELVIP